MIKIEVTGNSIAEVADKLLAIGGSLRATPATQRIDAPFKLNAIMPELIDEIVYVPDVVVGPAPTDDGVALEAAAHPVAEQPHELPEDISPAAIETVEIEVPAINADALKQLVLSVVAKRGRDAMVGVLDTFGVVKASDVPAEQAAELVTALEALL